MILLWFILGILLALGIARYNESNKLFWQLAIAFVLGYAVTTMLQKHSSNDKQSGNTHQSALIQMPVVTQGNLVYMIAKDDWTTKVTALPSVGQEFIEAKECVFALSEGLEGIRDQPPLKTLKPPEKCFQKVISTRHDDATTWHNNVVLPTTSN